MTGVVCVCVCVREREREREREDVVGVPERIGILKSLAVSGFKPQPPAWQASALSIVLCPSGNSKYIVSRLLTSGQSSVGGQPFSRWS